MTTDPKTLTVPQMVAEIERIEALPEGDCHPDTADYHDQLVAEIRRREELLADG